MKQISKCVFLLALFAVSTQGAQEKLVYWFNFPPKSDSWTVMLPAPNAKLVYEDTTTAVDIQSVVCDGKSIAPEVYGGPAGYPDLLVMDSPEGQVVYQTTTGWLQSWINLTRKKGDLYGMKKYHLPAEISTLEIVYVIRFPDGSRSLPLQVNFVALDRPTQIFGFPKASPRLLERDEAMFRESESASAQK